MYLWIVSYCSLTNSRRMEAEYNLVCSCHWYLNPQFHERKSSNLTVWARQQPSWVSITRHYSINGHKADFNSVIHYSIWRKHNYKQLESANLHKMRSTQKMWYKMILSFCYAKFGNIFYSCSFYVQFTELHKYTLFIIYLWIFRHNSYWMPELGRGCLLLTLHCVDITMRQSLLTACRCL